MISSIHKLIGTITAAVLSLILCLSLPATALAADSNARIISIFKIEGDDVKMTKGTKKQFDAKENVKLYDGYTISTGRNSYCYLRLDDNSLLKTDQKSNIAICKLSSTKLSVSLQSGGLFVKATAQKHGNTFETRAGNTCLGIRGTKYVIEHKIGVAVEVTMLEGAGEVDGRIIPAGYTMNISDNTGAEDKEYELQGSIISEEKSLFTLSIINEYIEELIASGIVDEDELELLADMVFLGNHILFASAADYKKIQKYDDFYQKSVSMTTRLLELNLKI